MISSCGLFVGGVNCPSSSVSVSSATSMALSLATMSSLALLSSVNLGWSYFPPSFFLIRAWKSIFDNVKSWIKAHWSANIAHKLSVPKRKCFFPRKRKCSGSFQEFDHQVKIKLMAIVIEHSIIMILSPSNVFYMCF